LGWSVLRAANARDRHQLTDQKPFDARREPVTSRKVDRFGGMSPEGRHD
jgi:hypothetical protein